MAFPCTMLSDPASVVASRHPSSLDVDQTIICDSFSTERIWDDMFSLRWGPRQSFNHEVDVLAHQFNHQTLDDSVKTVNANEELLRSQTQQMLDDYRIRQPLYERRSRHGRRHAITPGDVQKIKTSHKLRELISNMFERRDQCNIILPTPSTSTASTPPSPSLSTSSESGMEFSCPPSPLSDPGLSVSPFSQPRRASTPAVSTPLRYRRSGERLRDGAVVKKEVRRRTNRHITR